MKLLKKKVPALFLILLVVLSLVRLLVAEQAAVGWGGCQEVRGA